MNFKVAVVEDDEAARRSLTDKIERYAEEKGHTITVSGFSDAYFFLMNYKSDYAVIFLDIEMPGMNGMEAAKKVRQSDSAAIIVFVTNLAQYAVEGYAVAAFDFVLKPVSYPAFQMKFDRICKELSHRLDDHCIYIGNRTQNKRVRVLDIYYVESENHDLLFHTTDGLVRMRGTMADMEKRLAPHHFVRCNSCYLVNLRYIDNLCGDRVIVGGAELRISQSRRHAFLAEFARYTGGSV